MKRSSVLVISLLLFGYITLGIASATEESQAGTDSIQVISAPDLLSLSTIWANEYNRLHSGVKIKVISASDEQIADRLKNDGTIGIVSNDYHSGSQSDWKIILGRDVIVPVINSDNPFIDEISEKGITSEALAEFIGNTNSRNWGTLLKNGQTTPANYYLTDDESIASGVAQFLNSTKENIDGIIAGSGDQLINAIQKDRFAIGFCKMVNILDFKNQSIVDNIRLLPLDRNGNGLIDYNEKIYDDFNVFSRGIWIGKYPKPLFSNIYSVCSKQPVNENEVAFLKWVLTDGQQYLYDNGYSELLLSERQTRIDKLLTSAETYSAAAGDNRSILWTFVMIIAVLAFSFIIIDVLVRRLRRRKTSVPTPVAISHLPLYEKSLLAPGGIYFDTTHTWAFMEQNGFVKVGIDDFLLHVTGTLTRIKARSQGERITKGEQILSIVRNGKQLNLYSPVSGIIKEYNKDLDTNTSVINTSPYNEGWVYKIEPTNWLREIPLLFMADKYKVWLKNEFTRLKEFLSLTLSSDRELYAQVILQDGGELVDSSLADLGPEIWEDFQTNFIDSSR